MAGLGTVRKVAAAAKKVRDTKAVAQAARATSKASKTAGSASKVSKTASSASKAAGSAASASVEDKLLARAMRSSGAADTRSAVSKEVADAAKAKAKAGSATPPPSPKPATTGEKPDYGWFRELKNKEGWIGSKEFEALKSEPEKFRAYAKKMGMTDEQTAQALKYTRPAPKTASAGPSRGNGSHTSPPLPPRKPVAPSSGPTSKPTAPASPGSVSSAAAEVPASATTRAPASGSSSGAKPSLARRALDTAKAFEQWAAKKHPIITGTLSGVGALEGARRLFQHRGDIPDAPAAALSAFTQVPLGKDDFIIPWVFKNLYAGVGTAATGKSSSMAPVPSEKDLYTDRMLADLPAIEKAKAARAQFAKDLQAGAELGARLGDEGLDDLLVRIQADYEDGMSRVPQAKGLDRDQALKNLDDIREARLKSLSSAPGFRERLNDNAVRVAQIAFGTSDMPDLWTDEQRTAANRIREGFARQSLGDQMYPDFDAMQKQADAKRATHQKDVQ